MPKARSIFFFADSPTVETKKARHFEVSGLFFFPLDQKHLGCRNVFCQGTILTAFLGQVSICMNFGNNISNS